MNAYDEPRRWTRGRAAHILDEAEGFYLRILRAVILIIATLLLIYAGWLAASSAYKISKSPNSVTEQQAAVSPDDLTDAQMPAQPVNASKVAGRKINPIQNSFYTSFVDRYYSLYRNMFEPYRQQEDKQLSKAEFDGAFVNTAVRQQAIARGELKFEDDRRDLEMLLGVMREAAAKPKTIQRLKRYQAARKSPVTERLQKTRFDVVQSWDSNSMSCPDWYENGGCSAPRVVEVPYTETVTKMQYPDGTQSHTQIFRAFQDKFFDLLEQRRNINAAKAEREREGILSGIAEGRLSLMTALEILGGFLILMFFFLLIAIERHQRKLAAGRSGDLGASSAG